METWTRGVLAVFIDEQWDERDAPGVLALVDRWLARGDGAAIYRNGDLSSASVGEPRIVSYGSTAAQLEVEVPPDQLPDGLPAGAINWRFRLEAVCGGPAASTGGPRGTFQGLAVEVIERDDSGPFARVRVRYLASPGTPAEWIAEDALAVEGGEQNG